MKLTRRHFILLVILIYFTFIGGTFYSQLNFPLRVANQLIVTVILGLWLVGKIRRGAGLPVTGLDLPIALYLLANLLSALLGQSPRFSLEMMWFSVVHVLALYLLVDLLRRGWAQPLTWALYMASAVVCLVGLAEFLAWYVGTPLFGGFAQGWLEIGGWRQPLPPFIYRLNITLNGSTPLSAYLALLFPPAIGLILTLPRRDENRQALIVWLVLASVVQILTFSRAGVLALGVSLTLLFVGWLKISGWGRSDLPAAWQRLRPGYRLAATLIGLTAGGAGLFWLQRSFTGRAGSTDFRLVLWQTALRLFGEQPLSGVGPANFGRALLRLNEADLPRLQIATAHSIYLNTAAELGLIGLAAGAALFVAVGWAWLKRWQQAADRPAAAQIRLLACGAALVGLAAQTLVDTYPATPNMLPMLGLVAYIVADLRPRPGLARRYLAVAALLVLLVYGGWFARLAQADYHFQKSFRVEGRGDLAGAVAEAELARQLDPALALRTFRLAWLEARLADRTADPALTAAAIDHYRTGLDREPIWGLNSANLAGLLWQQGRRAEAIETMRQTVATWPDPLLLVNLGYFYEQQGDWAKAEEAYGRALSSSPGLAASGFWRASPARAERWPELVEAALAQVSTAADQRWLRVNLALAAADDAAVEALVDPATAAAEPQGRAALAETYLRQGRPLQAAQYLSAPESGQDYRRWGWLKLQQSDEAAAEKLLKTAVFLGDGAAYYWLGQLYEQQGDLPAAETAYRRGFVPHAISENEAVTIYGRFSGSDLGPQLVRLGLGERQAQSWLALAQLYEAQQRFDEAERIYQFLLVEDPFLEIAQERLKLLAGQTGQ
jgi:tetratricopeptide (TPR) repeat protein